MELQVSESHLCTRKEIILDAMLSHMQDKEMI